MLHTKDFSNVKSTCCQSKLRGKSINFRFGQTNVHLSDKLLICVGPLCVWNVLDMKNSDLKNAASAWSQTELLCKQTQGLKTRRSSHCEPQNQFLFSSGMADQNHKPIPSKWAWRIIWARGYSANAWVKIAATCTTKLVCRFQIVMCSSCSQFSALWSSHHKRITLPMLPSFSKTEHRRQNPKSPVHVSSKFLGNGGSLLALSKDLVTTLHMLQIGLQGLIRAYTWPSADWEAIKSGLIQARRPSWSHNQTKPNTNQPTNTKQTKNSNKKQNRRTKLWHVPVHELIHARDDSIVSSRNGMAAETKGRTTKSPGHTRRRVKQQKHHAETRDPPSQDPRDHMVQADKA